MIKRIFLSGVLMSVFCTQAYAVSSDENAGPGYGPITYKGLMVEDRQKLYSTPSVRRNLSEQGHINGDLSAPADYVMLNDLGTFTPIWASQTMFESLPLTDACLYAAWVNDKGAKLAINKMSNSAVRIQIANDYVSGKIKTSNKVTLKTAQKHTKIRRMAVESTQIHYAPFLDSIEYCLSDKVRGIKHEILSCDDEIENCPCYIPGKRGLEAISVSLGVDNQKLCSRYSGGNDFDDSAPYNRPSIGRPTTTINNPSQGHPDDGYRPSTY